MDTFFGISTGRLALGALGLLALAFAVLGVRAWRWPIFFRLGVRQLPRRPAQTALIAAGLMLSTALVAASLSTGDTITHSLRTAAVGELGRVDEIVTYSPTTGQPAFGGSDPFGGTFFPADIYDRIRDQALAIQNPKSKIQNPTDPALSGNVEAVTPAIWLSCTLLDLTSHQTAAGSVRALPPEYDRTFGDLADAAGRPVSLSDLQPDELLLNDTAGGALAAQPGDEVTCTLSGVPLRWRVRAVAAPSGLGAGTIAGAFVSLPNLQAALGSAGLKGVPGGVNQIWIANRGGVLGGAARTGSVVSDLRPLLADQQALAQIATLLQRPDYRAALASRGATLNDRTQRALANLLAVVDRADSGARVTPPAQAPFPRVGAAPAPDTMARLNQIERLLRSPAIRSALVAGARDVPDPALADAVQSALQQATSFQVVPLKQQILAAADRAGNVITTIFLLFSLLSIAASLLLIFLIFSLLAAARRTELGISRALGTERGHLIAMFTFEGVAYALIAAAVGVPAGLAVSRALVAMLVWSVQSGAYGFAGAGARVADTVRWTAEPRSVALAAALGLLLTVTTVAISAWRVSRVTIVTAIRDLPEPPPARGTPASWRARWWGLLLPAGGALVALGLRAGQTFPFAAGISLLLLFAGALTRGLVARRWGHAAGNRAGATLAGLCLALYWSLPFDAQQRFGLPRLAGGIEIFALAGVAMVAGAVWAVAANGDLAHRALTWMLTPLRRPAPALRLAAAHSLRNPFGTGLTAAMFAMVIFMLAVMQVITTSAIAFHANPYVAYGGFDLSAQTVAATPSASPVTTPAAASAPGGGSAALPLPLGEGRGEGSTGINAAGSFVAAALPLAPAPSASEALVGAATALPDLQPFVAGAGARTTSFFALLQLAAPSPAWGGYSVSAVDAAFAAANQIPLQTRARGYASDRDAWQAVAGSPAAPAGAAQASPAVSGASRDATWTVPRAIIDADALPSLELRDRPSVADFSFVLHGVGEDQTAMDPIPIWIGNPTGGAATKVDVIGIVDRRTAPAFRGLFISPATLSSLGVPPRAPTVRYYFRLKPGADLNAARAALGAAFFDQGLQTTDLSQQFQNQTGPLLLASKLLQFFVALGLFVGIAALGVISSRAAVERRQEIGVLRAIGYDRRQVERSLLLEAALVVLLGSGIGTGLALVLCRNVFAVQFFDRFAQGMRMVVPWDQLAFTVAATCVVALAAAWLPARQASRIPPMAALRGD